MSHPKLFLHDNDILVGTEGRTRYMSEGDLVAYCAQEKKSGEEVELTILSEAERLTVKLSLD